MKKWIGLLFASLLIALFVHAAAIPAAEAAPHLPSWRKSKQIDIRTHRRNFIVRLKRDRARKRLTQEQTDFWTDLVEYLSRDTRFSLLIPLPVQYDTTDAWGRTITVSGVIIAPIDIGRESPRSIPMLSFQHPTQVERQWSPSLCTAKKIFDDPQKNVALALVMASTGYIVVLPDYPGMGINYDVHPYANFSLGHSVVDGIRFTRNAVGDKSYFRKAIPKLAKWDGRLYMMGYSEGAYATMIAAKQIQLGYSKELSVSALAALDGPYSLSGTMRELMINAGPDYTAPYFLPYVMNGFDSLYYTGAPADQKIADFNYTDNVKTHVEGFDGNFAEALRARLNGDYTGGQISSFMKLATPWVGPRTILTPGFLANLQDTSSTVVNLLAENDSFRDWTPAMPLMMFHHKSDDLVPYGNAQEAIKAFADAGAPYVGLMPFSAHFGDASKDSIHGAAAPVAYLLGFTWMKYLADADDAQ